jgi:putative ATP-dependent endonuclease of OLD family
VRITRVVAKNFKVLRDVNLTLNKGLTILVGDNETGKSTLLEAIHLVLTGLLYGRLIANELAPYLFNSQTVGEYLTKLGEGQFQPPPYILIEAYFEDHPDLAKHRGINNSLKLDVPGVSMKIELNEDYLPNFREYMADPLRVDAIPTEYYSVRWFSFAHNPVTQRSVPVKSTIIDTYSTRTFSGADRYIAGIVEAALSAKEQADLSLAYRELRSGFSKQPQMEALNKHFAAQKDISDKKLSVSLDMSARSGWESNLMPFLDSIPFTNAGKGEQSSAKLRLAVQSYADAHIVLVEEPENHLSYSNMHRLVSKVAEVAATQQLVIATHSSFVLNKLGVENVILFCGNNHLTLEQLPPDTYNYFMKLPGHDTLRLILATKAILVEGPSDELIVQRAFADSNDGKSPLEMGVDVISVKSLSFKRFLDIAKALKISARVVTDNDGSVEKLKKRYEGYIEYICYDEDECCKTLEPQLLKANSRQTLNAVFGTIFTDHADLLEFMSLNKTDCALKIFSSQQRITYPAYILDAIKK